MQDKLGTFDARTAVLVVGIGKSGIASAAVLRGHDVSVFVTDEKPHEELRERVSEIESYGARFVVPSELGALLTRLSFVVISPGVPPTSPVMRLLSEANVQIIGEIELAYCLCAAPIIAVTGTKGKSTTTALIGALLRACGRTVRVGGNIGNPLVAEAVKAQSSDWVVAEVSSFQLETIQTFAPQISVFLNLTPDHLDRYPSMQEYEAAKRRIFANQGAGDSIVLSLDDPRLASLEGELAAAGHPARRLWFTLGDRRAGAAMYVHRGQIVYEPADGKPQPVLDRSDVMLAGEHNLRNVMAALLAAIAAGCPIEPLRGAVRRFQAMPHRLQPVGEIDGVLYVDDSKATTPAATSAALAAYERPVVLIAGGRPKGTDFTELGAAIRSHAKALVAIGEAAEVLVRAAGSTPSEIAGSIGDAVERARRHAEAGDIVLLSPACASFDMFSSAEERGERFARAIDTLRETADA